MSNTDRPMRARSFLLLTGLGLSLTACATTPVAVVAPATIPIAAAPGPAPIAGYDWFYNASEDEVSLSYGVAESDDVLLDLACITGTGKLMLLHAAAHDHPARIVVESGGDTETYPAETEPSELHDGLFLSATAPATDPVFQGFRRLGWLALLDDEKRQMMAAHPGSEDRIMQFFAACG